MRSPSRRTMGGEWPNAAAPLACVRVSQSCETRRADSSCGAYDEMRERVRLVRSGALIAGSREFMSRVASLTDSAAP